MLAISAEILHEILSYLSAKDLGSMRLVNHYFESAAKEHYFRTIRVRLTEAGLAKLQHISHQPELARCVRHLMYPYKRLEPLDHPPDTSDSSSATDGTWPWTKYYRKQTALEESGVFTEALKFALSQMHNLREITVNSKGDKCELHGREWPDYSITGFRIESCHDLEFLSGVFKELMAAASQANIRLDKLSTYPMWHRVFTDNFEVLWCTPLFQNLTSLSVFFCTNMTAADYGAMNEDVYEGRIFKFLSSAPRLRRLGLGLQWRPRKYLGAFLERPILPLLKILGDNHVWNYLETFFFHGPPINAEDLMNFFARHVTTLKTFGLLQPHLATGTWRGVLDFIKEEPNLCLENFILIGPSESSSQGEERCYYEEHEKARMADYVLRGGPPFPLTEAELELQK
ncbi:hypothetical protein RUND412_010555 [Rhizina undulata]